MLKNVWQTLFAAFVGGGVSATLVNVVFSKRHEQQRWLRDQKHQAAEKFLQVLNVMAAEMREMTPSDPRPGHFADLVTGSEQVSFQLISPLPVFNAAEEVGTYMNAWIEAHARKSKDDMAISSKAFRDSIDAFVKAARSDLNIS